MGSFVKIAIEFDRDAYGGFREDSFVYLEMPSTFIDIVTGLDDHRTAIAYIFGERAIEIERMGEATSKAHYGFAHGAYLEGKAAAERIIAMLSR